MFDEEFISITPVNFVQIAVECARLPEDKPFPVITKPAGKYLLPDTSSLCCEESFASVAMGWKEEGLEFSIFIGQPFKEAHYPDVSRGDSVEIFIDTRDVKTSGYNTKFCHHFFFLAEGVEGHFAGELTRFRTEDRHALCDPSDLIVKPSLKRDSQQLHIFIPKHCMTGYDPSQFDRFGFSYRINRSRGFPQHFSVVSEDFKIEEQPSLWASVKMEKK